MDCFVCSGAGCATCHGTGWIEMGGAGMVHPEILENMGIDSSRYTGFAAGMGIERLAMLLPEAPKPAAPVAVVPLGGPAEEWAAIEVLQSLRHAGVAAEMAYRGNAKRRMERGW